MNINITKEEIFEEVAKIAGYSAKFEATKKDAANNTFRRTAIFDPYKTLLDDVFEKGCNHVTDAIAHVAPYNVGQDENGYAIDVDMPYNWNSALEGELASTIKSYLVAHVTSMWMRIIENDDEDKYYKDSTVLLVEVARLLHKKRRVGRAEFANMLNNRRRANDCCCGTENMES